MFTSKNAQDLKLEFSDSKIWGRLFPNAHQLLKSNFSNKKVEMETRYLKWNPPARYKAPMIGLLRTVLRSYFRGP